MEIDLNKCLELNLPIPGYIWLYLVFNGQVDTASKIQSQVDFGKISDYLVAPGIVNRAKLRQLFNLSDSYFWEFYSAYPIKVPNGNGGYRMLRTLRNDTKMAKDMKKKYESRVKTSEQHAHVMRCLDAELIHRGKTNALMYLPAMEAYINGEQWEKAESYLETQNRAMKGSSNYGQDLL